MIDTNLYLLVWISFNVEYAHVTESFGQFSYFQRYMYVVLWCYYYFQLVFVLSIIMHLALALGHEASSFMSLHNKVIAWNSHMLSCRYPADSVSQFINKLVGGLQQTDFVFQMLSWPRSHMDGDIFRHARLDTEWWMVSHCYCLSHRHSHSKEYMSCHVIVSLLDQLEHWSRTVV